MPKTKFLWRTILVLMLSLCALPGAARASTFVVNRTDDSSGAGCFAGAENDCSLRSALANAKINSGPDTITFAPNVRGNLQLQSAQLAVDSDVNIVGPGAFDLEIDGDTDLRVMEISAGVTATVSGLTIARGAPTKIQFGKAGAYAYGGGIRNFGNLTLNGCSLEGNSAAYGAGVYSENATLTVLNSTFSTNVGGQALTSHGDSGQQNSAVIRNSTFFNNDKAIVNQGGTLSVGNCTITGNQTGIYLQNAFFGDLAKTTTVDNSIVVGNSYTVNGTKTVADVSNNDASSTRFTSGGYNLIGGGDAAGSFNAAGDITGAGDAGLGPLRDNGGSTFTFKPDIESPALDAGNSQLTTDQRGRPRPVDVPGGRNVGNASDIGAVEFENAQSGPNFAVNTPDDHDDGVCSADNCTLREAINENNFGNTARTIRFDAGAFAAPRKTIALRFGMFREVSEAVTIEAPAVGLTIDAGGTSRIFSVAVSGQLTLLNLTLSNGDAGATAGGDGITGRGGAIYNLGSTTLNGCTLSGNKSARGGALYHQGDLQGRALVLGNCTLVGNTGSEEGGAIYVFSGGVGLDSTTITANVSNYGLGVRCWGGDQSAKVSVHNTIIAGNRGSTGGDVDLRGGTNPNFVSGGYNLISGGNAVPLFNKSGDIAGNTAPGLGDLAENGGPTPTVALLDGSPALDAGDSEFTTDQRGTPRPQNVDDIGAYERAGAIAVAVFVTPKNPITNDTLTATVSASGSGVGTISYAYQWRKNGVALAGETGPTLQLGKPGNGDKGDVVSVQVTATGSLGGFGTGSASVTVINSAPVTFSGVVNAEAGVETAFAFRGADLDGDQLTYERAGGPVNGTAVIRADTDGVLKLFYTSRARYGGTDLIKFVARDTDGRTSNVATLSINVNYVAPPPANRPPVAGDTSIDTFTGKSEVKNLLGSDPDGDPLTFRIVRNAQYGSSEIKQDTDGKFKLFYTGLGKFFGPDSVTYVAVDDKNRTSNVATVSIHFINRAPNASDASLTVASGGAASKFLFGSDPDQNDISFKQINGAKHGTSEVKLDGEGKPRVFYQSFAGYVGPDTVTFVTVDPSGRTSAVATVSVTVVKVGASSSAGGGSGGGS